MAPDLSRHFPRYTEFDPLVPVWCITPKMDRTYHRFFDTSPFSPSGRYMGLTRMPFEDRMPQPGDAAEVVLVDIVYCLCKPDADAAGVSDEEFGRAMAGEAIDAAYEAFLEELVGFFRHPAKRRVLQKALGKLRELEAMAMATAEAKLDDPALTKRMEEAVLGLSPAEAGKSSTSLPASSESSPES